MGHEFSLTWWARCWSTASGFFSCLCISSQWQALFPSGSYSFRFRKSLTPLKEEKYLGNTAKVCLLASVLFPEGQAVWGGGFFGKPRQDGILCFWEPSRHFGGWELHPFLSLASSRRPHQQLITQHLGWDLAGKEGPCDSSSSLVNYCNWHNSVSITLLTSKCSSHTSQLSLIS